VNLKLDVLHLRRGNLGLVLPHHPGFFDSAPAMRATCRQRYVDSLVDARRDGTTTAASVGGSRLASRLGRMRLGAAARERRCLALAGAQGFFQQPAQPFVLRLQTLNLASQAGDLLGVRFLHHTPSLRARPPQTSDQAGTGAITLNKYNTRLLLLSKSKAYLRGLSNNHGQVGLHYMSHTRNGVMGLFF